MNTATDADTVDVDLLRSSAREFLGENRNGESGGSLRDLAGLDWTGLLVEESMGGAGWLPVETTVVAEEIGRAGDRSAWLGSVVAAAALSSAPEDARERWLNPLLTGAVAAAVVPAGSVVRVVRADQCGLLITLGRNGIHLIEDAEALPREADRDLLDVRRPAHRVDIGGAPGLLIGSAEHAELLRVLTRLLLSADSIGAVSGTLDRLVAYLRERVAFGAPIASFQAVQHRLVELLVFEVKSRAVVMKAVRALEADDPDAARLSAVAHAFVASGATAAVDECMQLSGGIGFTWEYPLHHALRRVFDNARLFGSARSSRVELAQASGW